MFRKWIDKIKDKRHKKQGKNEYDMASRTMSMPIIPGKAPLQEKVEQGLPDNFAKKLISLEIQCERPDATKEHVN